MPATSLHSAINDLQMMRSDSKLSSAPFHPQEEPQEEENAQANQNQKHQDQEAKAEVYAKPSTPKYHHLFHSRSGVDQDKQPADFVVQFGGQGFEYWEELKQAVNSNHQASSSLVHKLFQQSAAALLEESASPLAKMSPVYEQPIDLLKWLTADADKVPSPETFSRAFFSYPLIALTQLVNYLVFLADSGLRHQDMKMRTTCALGHSQGIVSAVVFSMSADKDALVANGVRFVRYLFWQGLRAQETFLQAIGGPQSRVKSRQQRQQVAPMLAIKGLSAQHVHKAIQLAKRTTPNACHSLQVSLVNGPQLVCVTGFPSHVQHFERLLEAQCATSQSDQSRVPFSQRKPTVVLNYVNISCPFHSELLSAAKPKVLQDVDRLGLVVVADQLQVPVFSTGQSVVNLQQPQASTLIECIVEMQLVQLADWTATWAQVLKTFGPQLATVVDFGPSFGAAKLTAPLVEGVGVRTVMGTTRLGEVLNSSVPVVGVATMDLFAFASWDKAFSPKIRCRSDGKKLLSTRFTRVLKRPPVMIGGMTPTTSLHGVDLVAAALNAGFHAELAAGGLPTPPIFESTVKQLANKLLPHAGGIAINLLYLNAALWSFQFPLVLRLRKEGWPIDSVTIAAGVPSKPKALEILQQLHQVGIRLVAFKPGTLSAIHQVIEIARAMPEMHVMIQWTGGRAGGHHSFEDFHEPLVAAYASIRRVSNVILVIGSGFGDWQHAAPYLTGEWSADRPESFGVAMPVDGILVASRVLVAKEAATATEVKQLLVETPGIEEERDWENSYKSIAGGIVTVTSELGEPIHQVATRGALCWREFDDKYFDPRLTPEEMEAAVRLDKDIIIARLNADFQKPYFGRKHMEEEGKWVSADLEEMTYAEVALRMLDLMYVESNDETKPSRWLDVTFRTRFERFMSRCQECFLADDNKSQLEASETCRSLAANDPRQALQLLFKSFPQCKTTLLSIADVDFFLDLCRTGGKPVNFVPVIDKDLRFWFKKDSLWYSEDLDGVPERDAQRVCILQGPLAVRFSNKVDEPVADILGGITDGLVKSVTLKNATAGAEEIDKQCPSGHESNGLVSSILSLTSHSECLSALVKSEYVVRDKKWMRNPLRPLFDKLSDCFALRELDPSDQSEVLRVFERSEDCKSALLDQVSAGDNGTSPLVTTMVEPLLQIVTYSVEETASAPWHKKVSVTLNEVRPSATERQISAISLQFSFVFDPEVNGPSLSEDLNQSINSVRSLYEELWLASSVDGEDSHAPCTVHDTFTTDFTVGSKDIELFCRALHLDELTAPLDFATVVAWKALIKCLFSKEVHGNLLHLVHLTHEYKLLTTSSDHRVDSTGLFVERDEFVTNASVSGLKITSSGKVISVHAVVARKTTSEPTPVIEILSEFLIRGSFNDFESSFSKQESIYRLTLSSEAAVELVRSQKWISWSESGGAGCLKIGDELVFEFTTTLAYSALETVSSISVSGGIVLVADRTSGSGRTIARIVYSCSTSGANPVTSILKALNAEEQDVSLSRKPPTIGGVHLLEQPWSIDVPHDALEYAQASGDLNPIHRSANAALLAELPNGKPIMHGMWTAGKVRTMMTERLYDGDDSQITSYSVRFEGMVYPGETLYMQLRQEALEKGRRILGIEVVNANGERVLNARAQVKQEKTAFVFTGQGSAQVGMGMDRYQASGAARSVWDRGEAHLKKTFGFSIVEIVTHNPKTLRIHFGGRKGKTIRENYMKLMCEDPVSGRTMPLLPEINRNTQSFTFSAPEGLLFATQFSQPALVLLEKALFAEIQAADLVPEDAFFAGHSLGEYAGLASFGQALQVEDVVEIVFLRGMIMQKAVQRDENGHSDFAMVAANPTRVGPHFNESKLHDLVNLISTKSAKLLQVVNYNVQDRQYVVAGDKVNLEALSLAMSALKDRASPHLEHVVEESLAQADAKKRKLAGGSSKQFTLTRGVATIPLAGIDVPFHSRELLGGVPAFRKLLSAKLNAQMLLTKLPLLEERYIPNLTAEPFSLETSYVEKVLELTGSPILSEALQSMSWQQMPTEERVKKLLVELLAYQFASPVQWIETQRQLFANGVTRVVEIGPAPTLTNMAQRMLQFCPEFHDGIKRKALFYARARDEIHFENDGNVFVSAAEFVRNKAAEEQAEENGPVPTVEIATTKEPPVPIPSQILAPPVAQLGAVSAPVDLPVSPLHALQVIIAVRLNKPLSDIKPENDIKSLSMGKSAVQNEIVGELEQEFGASGSLPEGSAEMPIKDLAAKLTSYKQLGKATNSLAARLVSNKMPAGFTLSKIKQYLGETKRLGVGHTQSVLLHALLLEPPKRLKNEQEAQSWLDEVLSGYEKYSGVSFVDVKQNSFPPAAFLGQAAPAVPPPKVDDEPVQSLHALRVILATKLQLKLSDVQDTSTIKALAAGKSAVQNELLGELEREFGSVPSEGASELKLNELAKKLPTYNGLGKATGSMVAKLVSRMMPGGFGLAAIKSYLASERLLPSGRIDSVLLHSLAHEQPSRFADEGSAKKWLDMVVDDYAKLSQISIPHAPVAGSGGPVGGIPAAFGGGDHRNTGVKELEQKLVRLFMGQLDSIQDFAGKDSLESTRRAATETKLREEAETELQLWRAEYSEKHATSIRPIFDPKMERCYDSYWNWVVQDSFELYHWTMLTEEEAFNSLQTKAAGPKRWQDEISLGKHFDAMSHWINEDVDELTERNSKPPHEWFKPYICNRATPELLRMTHYYVERTAQQGRLEYAEAVELLAEQVTNWLKRQPVNIQIFQPTKPQLCVLPDGKLDYREVPRHGVPDSIQYVDELARGLEYDFPSEVVQAVVGTVNVKMTSARGLEGSSNAEGVTTSDEESDEEDDEFDDEEVNSTTKVNRPEVAHQPLRGPKFAALRASLRKRTKNPEWSPSRRLRHSLVVRASSLRNGLDENLKQIILPHVHIRKCSSTDPTIRLYDVESTCSLLRCMKDMATKGVSFHKKVALVTGCGRESIGVELLKSLLEGGATIFVTTSSFSMKTAAFFRSLYELHGSRDSKLLLVPFNQASKQDTARLIEHIYQTHDLDVDFVIPFAAISENGRQLIHLDDRSEVAHRAMLTNTLRLLGGVAQAKITRGIETRPALVLLPLSPNHGDFGGDGLYAESKLGMESLLRKWTSEGWGDQLSIIGAVIGWTRGTGLMESNNIVAQDIEALGVRTFSKTEMGFNLSALLHPEMAEHACEAPIWADLTGGMAQVRELKKEVDMIRQRIQQEVQMRKIVTKALASPVGGEKPLALNKRANLSGYFCNAFPSLAQVKSQAITQQSQLLNEMIDLERVVVVTGFGEVGPYGSSRTRWEMESYGEFSLEGCIELAWMTGLIIYDNGQWRDAKTRDIVADHDIKRLYEEQLLTRTGIRVVEPELVGGYDPNKKLLLQQVAIEKPLAPVEVSDYDEALMFQRELGSDNVDVFQNEESGIWMVRLRQGAVVNIPRAMKFDRFVAGQIPTGWTAERLGIPNDLAKTIDPLTLYALVATVEALVSAGVTDPYEFYHYVHVSQIGNTSGGGMGGQTAFKHIYQYRLLGKDAPSDSLQECFINTAAAWINMLLLSSSGPIKTPVGACATAAESIEIGTETIQSGKARVVLVGGYDDFGEEGSYEFAQMKATSNSVDEKAMGREPREMCRPCSSTRAGFMESHGAGIQVLMDAKLALEMGCPIYAVVALTNTATDKTGRSVPAPGQGILTTAREISPTDETMSSTSPLLDIEFRRRQFDSEMESIERWFTRETVGTTNVSPLQLTLLNELKASKVKAAQALWGSSFFKTRDDIAPLRGALGVWNLTIDDLGVVSFHGTGTKANDKNESEVTQKQLEHLGRSIGNPVPVICQKHLTGHPKGAAAAWMLNGLVQVLQTGIVPGNRNLDNVCQSLRQYEFLTYPSRSVQTGGGIIKAALMKSFGFGQAGGEVLLVHPDLLLATLKERDLGEYAAKRSSRLSKMNSHMQRALLGKSTLVQVKNSAPYSHEMESKVYLDPKARASFDPARQSWHFKETTTHRQQPKQSKKQHRSAKKTQNELKSRDSANQSDSSSSELESVLVQTASAVGLGIRPLHEGIGVDVEPIATFSQLDGREHFLQRNFTNQEMMYCFSSPDPSSSFAGRWAAKEAVIKAISSAAGPASPKLWTDPSASLREIEVFVTATGAPSVVLSGSALEVFNRVGLESVAVSISHSGDYAVAQALAKAA